ncbi:MAG TPA: hypothetical protein VGG41_16600 [Solirubrobacteraceae bacterium]|jgi:hypothetical protein
MSVIDHAGDPDLHRASTDVPALRALLAWTGAVGLCLAAALGISAILGASLTATAIRLAGSGLIFGLDALFAVGSATLAQRSPALRVAALIGVLATLVTLAVSLAAIWGANVSETLGRVTIVASGLSSALGLTGFLLSQQRDEDPPLVSALMYMTLLLDWVLTVALIIDVLFASGSTSGVGPVTTGVQLPLNGLAFDRFLGVAGLLTLLGLLLLPLLRRAHPAYRGGRPAR